MEDMAFILTQWITLLFYILYYYLWHTDTFHTNTLLQKQHIGKQYSLQSTAHCFTQTVYRYAKNCFPILASSWSFIDYISYRDTSNIELTHCKIDDSNILFVLGFNDTSTLEGHFVSSPRERKKRDRRESRGDEREGQRRKRNRNESEETEEIKTFPLYPYPLQG